MVVGPKRVNIKYYPLRQIELDKTKSRYIILLFCFLVVICSLILNLRGYTSKVYMKEANDLFYRVGVHLVRFLTMFLLIHLCYIYENKKNNAVPITILTGIVLLLFSLFTGERDVIFRFAFIFMLLLFAFQKVKRRHIFLFIPIGVVFMIGSVYLKYYFTSGVLNEDFIEEGNVLTQFLSTDFSAAGRNLQYLLINNWTEASQGWQLLFTETITPLFPSGIFLNPDRWFNTQVHNGNYTGYAFTLVGTGYIICGYLGVIAIFIIIGILARCLYRRSLKDLYNMAFYLFMISTIIFSFRQSLSTVFSGMIKVGFVSIILSRLLVPHSIRNVKAND